MANPQPENGFVRVANEIWDEIICRSFSKRQIDIILFILRLSYGCNKKTAKIPLQQDFILAGLGGKGNIALELKRLEAARVITRNKEAGEYALNKDYETWDVGLVKGWEKARFEKLLNLNLDQGKKQRKLKAGRAPKSSQNENSQMGEEFSKREPEVSGEVLKLRTEEKGEVLKIRTDDEKEFLKREPKVLEIRTETSSQPLQDAASEPSKDIKDINILKTYIYTVFEHWNSKKIKVHRELTEGLKSTINARLKVYSLDELIQAINLYHEVLKSDDHFFSYKWPLKDFMNPKNLENFLAINDPLQNYLKREKITELTVSHNGGKHKTRHDLNNESILDFAGGEYGSAECSADFGFNQSCLPELRNGQGES
ncbi:replication protein [Paenibacillus sp. GbtcB18]|uniref:replication protein n=1 Tax=Paenibacillus sp. GbtcB18 TaxID=2824763 RepID=UPI001C2F2A9F|nr:replication protein [Paenibacillus sp. GbtcB18]